MGVTGDKASRSTKGGERAAGRPSWMRSRYHEMLRHGGEDLVEYMDLPAMPDNRLHLTDEERMQKYLDPLHDEREEARMNRYLEDL